MSSNCSNELVCWYVIHTLPSQEERAKNSLRAFNIETLAPKTRKTRINQYTGKSKSIIKPLFPRYIFALFRISSSLNKVRYASGVHSIVSFGDGPARVDEETIKAIQSYIDGPWMAKIRQAFKPGDEVLIKDGPLKYFMGIFEREMSDSEQVMILLNTLSFQAHVVVEKDLVAERWDSAPDISSRGDSDTTCWNNT